MTEYSKIKQRQDDQLGSIDKMHPMKVVAIMTGVQVAVVVVMLLSMGLIGISL